MFPCFVVADGTSTLPAPGAALLRAARPAAVLWTVGVVLLGAPLLDPLTMAVLVSPGIAVALATRARHAAARSAARSPA